MTASFSIVLDFVRLLAAVIVMAHHCAPKLFGTPGDMIPGHDAVVVFFLLSGYVIAFVTSEKERSLTTYAVNRLSRIWSVALPALALGLVIEAALATATPAQMGASTLLNLTFLAESWAPGTFAPLNSPMWSLNYEFWYYVIFGLYWFVPRNRARTASVLLACLIAGPKILVLMPIWLLGVALFRFRPTVPSALAAVGVVVSLLAWALTYVFGLHIVMQAWLKAATHGYSYLLGSSSAVLFDYLLAGIFAVLFVCVENLVRARTAPIGLGKAIRFGAGFTLSIYLFHMPLLAAATDGAHLHGVPALAAIAGSVMLLALVTEFRRYAFRNWIEQIVKGAGVGLTDRDARPAI